jgi:hypothetical protein
MQGTAMKHYSECKGNPEKSKGSQVSNSATESGSDTDSDAPSKRCRHCDEKVSIAELEEHEARCVLVRV